jgi:transposase
MLDQKQRTAILALNEEGHGSRAIARMLGVSRGAVREVLRAKSAEVPRLVRSEKGEAHREEILELYTSCKGNLVRVHELLVERGAMLSYQALTAFCRRHGIGHEPKTPAGRYDFGPGEEMQHDTSPHVVEFGGKQVKAQTASLVLAHSQMLFFQCYPNVDRITCKLFLTEALRFFGGAAARCMIDNTHVVVLRGSGAMLEPVSEMAAFAARFGFAFAAHEIGDANRSARVERPFDHIDNNFLAHRPANDWEDFNAQARTWCEKTNATPKRSLHAAPRDLFAVERLWLRPLPRSSPRCTDFTIASSMSRAT